VVKADTGLAVCTALVSEGVLHLCDVAGLGAGEIVVAHGDRDVAVAGYVVVFEDNLLPALTAVDGEAAVFLVAVLDSLVADEVGHCVSAGGAEGRLGSLGRLEKHIAVAVAVQVGGGIAGSLDVVTILSINGRNLDDRGGPRVLASFDFGFGDSRTCCIDRNIQAQFAILSRCCHLGQRRLLAFLGQRLLL